MPPRTDTVDRPSQRQQQWQLKSRIEVNANATKPLIAILIQYCRLTPIRVCISPVSIRDITGAAMSKSPSPRLHPPAVAMAARAGNGSDGGSGGEGEKGKEGSDALTHHADATRMSPEPDSTGQRQRQAASAASSAEPVAAVVQGCNTMKC